MEMSRQCPIRLPTLVRQAYQSLAVTRLADPLFYRISLALLALYLPGGPFMISNMWGNRKVCALLLRLHTHLVACHFASASFTRSLSVCVSS